MSCMKPMIGATMKNGMRIEEIRAEFGLKCKLTERVDQSAMRWH